MNTCRANRNIVNFTRKKKININFKFCSGKKIALPVLLSHQTVSLHIVYCIFSLYWIRCTFRASFLFKKQQTNKNKSPTTTKLKSCFFMNLLLFMVSSACYGNTRVDSCVTRSKSDWVGDMIVPYTGSGAYIDSVSKLWWNGRVWPRRISSITGAGVRRTWRKRFQGECSLCSGTTGAYRIYVVISRRRVVPVVDPDHLLQKRLSFNNIIMCFCLLSLEMLS